MPAEEEIKEQRQPEKQAAASDHPDHKAKGGAYEICKSNSDIVATGES